MDKPYHALLCGDSREGKSTLLAERHSRLDCPSIVVRAKDSDSYEGTTRQSAEGLITSFEEAQDPSEVKIDMYSGNKSLRTMASTAILFADNVNDKTGEPVHVGIDEAHNAMPDTDEEISENAVRWALHEGAGNGVFVTVASQDPQDFAYTPIKQCEYFTWVGRPNGFHGAFFGHNISKVFDESKIETQDQYEYTVFDKRGNVLYGGETDPSY